MLQIILTPHKNCRFVATNSNSSYHFHCITFPPSATKNCYKRSQYCCCTTEYAWRTKFIDFILEIEISKRNFGLHSYKIALSQELKSIDYFLVADSVSRIWHNLNFVDTENSDTINRNCYLSTLANFFGAKLNALDLEDMWFPMITSWPFQVTFSRSC